MRKIYADDKRRKLSDAQVIEIRGRHSNGESQQSLVKRFGVSRKSIQSIIDRKTWRSIPEKGCEIDLKGVRDMFRKFTNIKELAVEIDGVMFKLSRDNFKNE